VIINKLAWKYLADCLAAIRSMAIALEAFYVAKTMGVQRVQLSVLLKRTNALLQALRDFGSDVANAAVSRPSPYG
jgi:hypothetical protein